MILLTGGSACGKSTFAEMLAAKHPRPRYYIAAMRPYGEESEIKIERHRIMRAEKGFFTIERYTDIAGLRLPGRGIVLLECLCNLTANEMFDRDGAGPGAAEAIIKGIESLKKQSSFLIVVTNEVGSGIENYDDLTPEYIEVLGYINRRAAKMADTVLELVCGIPLLIKGEMP